MAKIQNFLVIMSLLLIAGCSVSKGQRYFTRPPQLGALTSTSASLANLRAPEQPVNVAVYDFPDFTGARRSNSKFPEDSRAVTQGAASVVVNALKSAGRGRWFNVVERSKVGHLLQERKLIQDTYKFLKQDASERVQPLVFADYLITGGIIAYNSDIETGGIGATYLGIGGRTSYKKDYVTVTLRMVSVKDGKVIKSITASKTIYSVSVSASVSRFISVDNLLDASGGVTTVQPTQIAVREAIELAIYKLVKDGARAGVWRRPGNRDSRRPHRKAVVNRHLAMSEKLRKSY